jgi:hypothetical protein
MEVQKGVRGIQQEIHDAVTSATTIDPKPSYDEPEDREEATAPKYEPPTSP